MMPLPIDPALPQAIEHLRRCRRLVLTAPPGAGKTTRVPPALLRARLLSNDHPNIVMLQPRRVAARAAAMRIAEENGWTLGGEVGYHVRFERHIGPNTRLRVLTEAILTRQLLADPFLEGVGAVILDEFHERSIHTDLAIAMLREIQQTVREDLLLVVMSATLEAEPVARFLGNCPILRVEGRAHPVRIAHSLASATRLPERIAEAVQFMIEGDGLRIDPASPALPPDDDGDVLVFLPGMEEIRRCMRMLEPLAQRQNLLLLPLHGSLTPEEQIRALGPADRRKIILATNIAETSLTIEGVTTVVDSGLARQAGFDARRGLDRLELVRISKASAAQRAGRAGRTAPGRTLRLWTSREHHDLSDFDVPEVHRIDLCATILAIHSWGSTNPRAFGWYEAPADDKIAAAERLLTLLGALDAEQNGKITPLGRRLLSLPVHPRLGRLMLAAAHRGLLAEGAALAALLSERDILPDRRPADGPPLPPSQRHPQTQGDSDLLLRLQLLEQAEQSRFDPRLRDRGLDLGAARHVLRTRDQLLRIARRLPQHPSPPPDQRDQRLLQLILEAYPDRVARRRGEHGSAVMVGGGGVRLAAESIVTRADLFLALDARQDQRSLAREAFVRIASAIQPEWLERFFPQSIRQQRTAVFDDKRQAVVGVTREWYRDLLLQETADTAVDPHEASVVLAEALRPRAAALFAADPAAESVLSRVALLRRHMPEHPWPQFTTEELAELLVANSPGKRSVEQVLRTSLAALLLNQLHYPLDRLLAQHAPESIEVPTGNRIRIRYWQTQPPHIEVRLQELFGWTDTPRIAGGRVPVVIHLLGPNYRPVQITDDLRSFWSTTYFQVRKDLRSRYPKHSWPEDPLTAKPEAKGSRRR